MNRFIPLIWMLCILAGMRFMPERDHSGLVILSGILGYGIYETAADRYLTRMEKAGGILLILVLSIVGICLVQLYSSSVMRKRFRLDTGIGKPAETT